MSRGRRSSSAAEVGREHAWLLSSPGQCRAACTRVCALLDITGRGDAAGSRGHCVQAVPTLHFPHFLLLLLLAPLQTAKMQPVRCPPTFLAPHLLP